ncbi:MAG: alanine racemase, partial [Bacteroidales bacterium]|nr:alanine racemase [Bacteroidales bacterium]
VEAELYKGVAKLVEQKNITKFIGIGEALCRNKDKFSMESVFFSTTSDFLKHYMFSNFQSETILLKGARIFEFESIAKVLQRKSHQTIMEVNLEALVRNLNYYRSRLSPNTKIMAMVKAFSYGAGNVEIANTLQFHNVDYLTVAYADEGVELRKSGITLPIMVMNPEEESFDDIIKYNLEPDIYSFRILDDFVQAASLYSSEDEKISIHIELDTGMHRLGFMEADMPELIGRLKEAKAIKVKSFFSHLACSEDSEMDYFTRSQIQKFREWSTLLKDRLGRKDVLCHILNSSGIVRFPEAEMDMVRLGIGLYGIAPDPEIQKQLTLISKLKTKISQIKSIPQGDSVGYNCKWVAKRDSRIAIIPIGYADGLDRKLGDEVGKVLVNGKVAPIIGRICMDMSFVDVTDIECKETDEVVIFGNSDSLHQLADSIGTISYEVLTSVSQRVKRVYFWE